MDTERLLPAEARSVLRKTASHRVNKRAAFCFLIFVALITFWSYFLLMSDNDITTAKPVQSRHRQDHNLDGDEDFLEFIEEYPAGYEPEVKNYDENSKEDPYQPEVPSSSSRDTTTVKVEKETTTVPVINQATTVKPEPPLPHTNINEKGKGTQNKTIFLIDSLRPSDGALKLTPRQACAVESAAKNNPDWVVVLLTLDTTILDAPTSNTSAFKEYPNIKVVNTTLLSLVEGTVAEVWVRSGALTRSLYPTVHYSDFLRLFVLYKYGGVYLDTDFIILKSLDPITPNFSVAETEYWVESAAMGFTTDGFGHFVIQHLVQEFMNTYNETIYAYNGPGLLTRFSQRICYTTATKEMTRDNCFDFEVLPTKTFYPIGYKAYGPLFNETQLETTMNLVKESYAMHAWNGLIGQSRLKVGTKAAIGVMAEQNCPKVYATCGSEF